MFNKFKKAILFGVCLMFASLSALPSVIKTNSSNAYADGVAEIAMELESGTVFHKKNEELKLPMASTTKIMTALIVAEDCDLTEVISVPDEAVGVEGSSIYLKREEKISVKDLLYGLMLRSGNDAATALAIHHSGSVENFVEKMNSRAEELGANKTHFKNPSGLPDAEHYTTARDLCTITCSAMKNEIFAKVVGTKSYSGDFRAFTNKNKLLNNFDGANGVKTGYTEKAGRCLVSSAKRAGMDVVCVVLNCYDMFERSQKIIEGCFDKYAVETISNNIIFNFNGTPCKLNEDARIIVEKGKELDYKVSSANCNCGAIAQLNIYCEKSLIFNGNLFTIK